MDANPNLNTPLAKSSLAMMFIMLAVIGAGLAGSGILFSGYLGGGRSAIGVLQAFLLCFGTGAVIYGPAIVIFLFARSVRANGPSKAVGIFSVIIALPVWIYGGLTLIFYPTFWLWGGLALALGLYLTYWAVIVLRHSQ